MTTASYFGYTPGDWWADDRGHIHNDPIGSVKVAKVDGANVAQAIANARLISSAPDLLEALIELRDWYLVNTGMPAVKANAAISKVRGLA
jgi:hypothetical protein